MTELDPIRRDVIKNALDTLADEMALIIMRSAYSAIVRDAMDYSTAVCDAAGRTLAQGLTTPLHLGSFYDAMKVVLAEHGGRLHPDDVFIFNDPYLAGGQHLPDIYIVQPAFHSDTLIGFATTVAHQNDVGGIVPGSNSIGSTEIYQEGLRLPLLKLRDAGRENVAIWKIIEANVRVPRTVFGDLRAQMAACRAGVEGFQRLAARYGVAELARYFDAIHDYAERLARAGFASIPDGEYRFEHFIDGVGEAPEPIPFRVCVTVRGDQVTIDWTGTSPQIEAGINAPMPFTRAAAYTALRSVVGTEIPNAEGFARPITVIAPEGSLVNPVSPAACGARGITGFRMVDCLFGALAQAVPERVAADGSGGATIPAIGGSFRGEPYVLVETLMGNWGATAGHDGMDGVAHMGANQSNIPVELIETLYPVRIERYGLVPDTGGPGRFRGGLAIERSYRLLQGPARLTVRSDKRDHRPYGLAGGGSGSPSLNVVLRDGEQILLPVLLQHPWTLRTGDVYRHVMAGGGGFGDPHTRAPEAVLADVRAGRVSPQAARADYAVVVRPDGEGWCVDEAATARLRAGTGGAGHGH